MGFKDLLRLLHQLALSKTNTHVSKCIDVWVYFLWIVGAPTDIRRYTACGSKHYLIMKWWNFSF